MEKGKILKLTQPIPFSQLHNKTVLLKLLMGNLLCEDSPSAGLMHALGGAIPNKFPDDADAAGLWIIL